MAFERKLFLDIFARDRGVTKVMDDVADKTDKTTGSVSELTKEAGELEKQLDETRGSLRKLIADFDKTGDVKLFKEIRAERRQMSFLTNLQKQAEELAQPDIGNAIGETFGDAMLKGIGAAIKSGGPAIIGGLAAIAISLLPFIGGVAASAVLGGVGSGGIIGGIALAAQDSRVKEAGTRLAATASEAFSESADSFVNPVVAALGDMEASTVRFAGQLRPAFDSMSKIVTPLSNGLIGLVEQAMPGFIRGMEASKPVFRALGNELPKLGREIGTFISVISEDTDGAVLALHTLFKITGMTLRQLGLVISTLSNIYEWTVRASSATAHFLEDLPLVGGTFEKIFDFFGHPDEQLAALEAAKDASHDYAGELHSVGTEAERTEEKLLALKTAFDLLFGVQMGIDQATVNFHKSLRELNEELRDGERTLDLNKEAGLENRSAVLSHIQAIEALREANINNNMAVDDANRIYDQHLEQLSATLIKLGYNKDEVKRLIEAYRSIPGLVSSQVKIDGLEGAIARTRELARLLGSISAGARASLGDSSGYGGGRAGGGPVQGGMTYMVGEEGPELVRFGRDGYVVNARDTARALSTSPGGGGDWPGMMPISVTIIFPPSGDPVTDHVVAGLRERVRHETNGDVTLFFEVAQ